MKKRGFTLIELLAVIVILAIIALIATPIVMNIIENVRKGAAERSAQNYLRTLETAITANRIDGKIMEGEYEIKTDGGLCPTTGCGQNEIDKIKIDMSGNKPSSGTIYINNGIVSINSVMNVGDYKVSYNTEKKVYVASIIKLSCRPTTATGDDKVTTGNVPTPGEYNYGDEYICDPGDGVERRFFVLEDGNETELTKTDFFEKHTDKNKLGSVSVGEVALIMNQNIDREKIRWCESDADNSCNAVSAKEYLKSLTIDKGWTVDVSLPTYAQIEIFVDSTEGKLSIANELWLYDYLDGATNNVSELYGYWTSTADSHDSSRAWGVQSPIKELNSRSVKGSFPDYGVRPVITVYKEFLN